MPHRSFTLYPEQKKDGCTQQGFLRPGLPGNKEQGSLKRETSKTSPPGADCLHNSRAAAQGGESTGGPCLGSLGRDRVENPDRSRKQDKVAKGKSYPRKDSRDLWRVPSSSQQSTEINGCNYESYPRVGGKPSVKTRKQCPKLTENSACSHQSDWRNLKFTGQWVEQSGNN